MYFHFFFRFNGLLQWQIPAENFAIKYLWHIVEKKYQFK